MSDSTGPIADRLADTLTSHAAQSRSSSSMKAMPETRSRRPSADVVTQSCLVVRLSSSSSSEGGGPAEHDDGGHSSGSHAAFTAAAAVRIHVLCPPLGSLPYHSDVPATSLWVCGVPVGRIPRKQLPRSILGTSSLGYREDVTRACRRGCYKDAMRKLFPWNSSSRITPTSRLVPVGSWRPWCPSDVAKGP